MSFEIVPRGLSELRRAFEDVAVKVDPVLGRALTAAAGPVKADVRRRASADDSSNARTVSGIRIRRKGTVVRVEQGQRKTTGYHAQYGAYQQSHFFDPALRDNQEQVVALTRRAMDGLAAKVNGLP